MDFEVTVMYSCPLCLLNKQKVIVPARREEGVIEWMDKTIILLGQDHQLRSPSCHPTELKDVMIPLTGTNKVGGPVLQ